MCCIIKLTLVIPIQQQNPIMRGLPPVLISFIIWVFNPMAAMAMVMKNLLSDLTGLKTSLGTPNEDNIVENTEAKIK